MRKKIWRMSEGQFQNTVPRITLEPDSIAVTIPEDSEFRGSFNVICERNFPTKGLIYCDHPYIFIKNPAFDEEYYTINYTVTATNLRAGDELSGFFYIYSEGCVLRLPFHIVVKRRYPTSSLGDITGVGDFHELARRSFKEAVNLFYSKEFRDLMMQSSKDYRLIYRGFSEGKVCEANVEEFLCATGEKARVVFDVDTERREFSYVDGNRKESIDITRNTWGYIRIEVSSDSDFVTVENNVITSDFFLGSKLSLNYYIHKERLHEGKNYAVITLSGNGIVRSVTILASTGDLSEKTHTEDVEIKREVLKLYKTYEEFRLKGMGGAKWAADTIEILDNILEKQEEGVEFYRLIKAHALIVQGDRKEALSIIKDLRTGIIDKRSANWAYLLYLGALMEPEEEYVNRLCREIEAILDVHPEDVRIFWFLLFLKQEYVKNSPNKLRAIRHWINEGFYSSMLYAECYEIYMEDTYLLDSLDDINIKILKWAAKNNGLTRAICDRIFDLLLKETGFSKKVYRILLAAYPMVKNETHLKHLISYMLKGGAIGEEYTDVYRMGIENNLLLAGLFEAYLQCLPLNHLEKLSSTTLRYFSYNSNIPDERKALVYSNIIIYKDEDPQIYENYIPRIRDFALSQMKQGRIDDNLCVIYQDIIDSPHLDSKLIDSIPGILFAKKVICILNGIRRVIVVEDELGEPIVAPMRDHLAFVPIYTDDYRIFIEYENGDLSCDEKQFYIEDSIKFGERYDEIRNRSNNRTEFFYKDLSEAQSSGQISDIYEEEAMAYLFSSRIDPGFLSRAFPVFMSFFKAHAREDVILKALLQNDRYKDYDANILTYLVNMLIIDGDDRKALSILSDYLLMGVDKRQLLNCLRRVCENSEESKGEFVLELCISLLREGYQSPETIEYLLYHFIGLNSDMRAIFKYAVDGPALRDFCERFLVQGLYSGDISADDDEILIAYLDKNPSPVIVEAYISYFCHLYLTEGIEPPVSVFAILLRELKHTDAVNDACRFAYCKHLCQKKSLSKQEEETLELLLSDQITRNIYFPFYEDMEEKFIKKFHLYDRMYVSINTEPKMDLVIAVTMGEERLTLDIPEVYDGIYVKDFIIFFGESIQYNIFERNKPTESLLYGEYSYQDICNLKESRFYLINRMQEDIFYKETGGLTERIVDYKKRSEATKDIFRII